MIKQMHFDRELQAILPLLSGVVPLGMTLADLDRFRLISSPARADFLAGRLTRCVDYTAQASGGSTMVVSVISPDGLDRRAPCIYFLHGGGMVMGNRFAGANPLLDWAEKFGLVCVTPEYRLAPEHLSPVPVEDCYEGLRWTVGHATELGIDPDRIIIFGGSAGGGLAAGVALMARDRGGPKLIGQILQCPMIDDRNQTNSALAFDGIGVWDTTSNVTAWRALLGEKYGTSEVSEYTAPARALDLRDLPPTYIDVGACEVFRDEDIEYAFRIMQSGGDCELHVWSGAFHGFYDIAPHTAVARACLHAREKWLEKIIAF